MRAPWWAKLVGVEGGVVDTDYVFAFLMAPRDTPWVFTGVAGEEDPWFATLEGRLPTASTPLGAVELDGATVLFLETSGEHSSECLQCFIAPGCHARTRLPSFPVRIERASAIHWDDPSKNQDTVPVLLALVDAHTLEALATFGTEFADPYYPSARCVTHPSAMTRAAPWAHAALLHARLPEGVAVGARKPRL